MHSNNAIPSITTSNGAISIDSIVQAQAMLFIPHGP